MEWERCPRTGGQRCPDKRTDSGRVRIANQVLPDNYPRTAIGEKPKRCLNRTEKREADS